MKNSQINNGALAVSIVSVLFVALTASCTQRQAGSSEIFSIRSPEHGRTLHRLLDNQPTQSYSKRVGNVAGWNDRVRSNDDVVTMMVHSAYIHKVPETLVTLVDGRTGYDLLLFAEVQENSAAGYDAPALVSIIYSAKDVQVPGVINFTDAVAYGPTLYKGSPLKIKLTMMLLVRNTADQEAQVVDLIGGIFGQAAPQYASVASAGVGVIRAILEAQPDVAVFDFETTFYSDEPEDLIAPILASASDEKVDAEVEQGTSRSLASLINSLPSFASVDSHAIENSMSAHAKMWAHAESESSINLPFVRSEIEASLLAEGVEPDDVTHLRESGQLTECAGEICRVVHDASQKLAVGKSGKPSPVLGHRDWDKYFPWLTYGFYAIVETQPRGRKKPVIGLDSRLKLRGQYLVDDDNAPLQANYLVFGAIPGQVEQQAEVLRAASRLNSELLSSLTRSEESIAQAWKDIKSNSQKMMEAILKVRAEREARKLRRKAESCDKFVERFKNSYSGLVGSLLTSLGSNSPLANMPADVFKTVALAFVPKNWAGDDECSSDINDIINDMANEFGPKGPLQPEE